MASSIVFLDRRLEPLLDEVQHVPVAHATGDALHQLGMRDAVKVTRQVRIDDVLMTGVQQPMDRSYRILRPAFYPVSVLLRLQVRFENGLQHDHGRRLYHSVGDRRNPQWA